MGVSDLSSTVTWAFTACTQQDRLSADIFRDLDTKIERTVRRQPPRQS